MVINRKCPKCGSSRVQLANERSKHGCFWFLVFGIFYIFYVIFKWFTGMMIFICYDIWMFIANKTRGRGYVWQCLKWFSGNKRFFYCHECGYNFRA